MTLEIITEHRAISVETLEQAGVEWVDGDNYSVRIPYNNYTGTWYVKQMLDPRIRAEGMVNLPKALNAEGRSTHLYNPFRLNLPGGTFFVLCEGEFDTLSVLDAGFPAIGTGGTKGQFRGYWARLFDGATIVIASDGDDEGNLFAEKMKPVLTEAGAFAYRLPMPAYEDLNDLHQQGILRETIDVFLEAHNIEGEYLWN